MKEKEVLKQIVNLAKKTISPSQILLFGSRSRGDNSERADFDLAFKSPIQKNWLNFKETVEEKIKTLCNFDLIVYEKANAELKKNIDKEAKIIYEKKIK